LQLETANAVKQGIGGEDDSQGYALFAYPPARAVQLKMRAYARANTGTLIRVLNSCPEETQRAVSATILGYANQSSRQVAGLVAASFDASDLVRNNAIRALAVLAGSSPGVTAQIPIQKYSAHMRSLSWFDRNKTVALLEAVSRKKDPKVMGILREHMLTPLREMAQWKSSNHALVAALVLGRMAGLEESRILQLCLTGNVAPILDALH
jgi:hypothetical protein